MSANGICSDNVIQQLVNDGHSVTVLANASAGCESIANNNGIKMYCVKQRLSLRLKEWGKINQATHPRASRMVLKFAFAINKLQLFVTAPIWPRVSLPTIHMFKRAALKLHSENHYDIVITVYTPIEALLAGYAVKKKYPEIKYIPYFLDALAGGWGPNKWSKAKIERHTRRLEKMIAKRADLIISMNSSRDYHLQHPLETKRSAKRCFLDVPTLLLPKEQLQPRSTFKTRYQLLYSGYINYPQRDPVPLLEVMARLCNISDVTVTFAGTCNKPKLFQPYILASNGKIRYLGQQSHDEIIALAQQSDYFLNIGSKNPSTIACKIFEYMLFQKPIISTYSIENEPSIPYIKKYGQYFLIDERRNDYDAIARDLQHYIENMDTTVTLQHASLEELFYANTPKAFTACIDELVGDKT